MKRDSCSLSMLFVIAMLEIKINQVGELNKFFKRIMISISTGFNNPVDFFKRCMQPNGKVCFKQGCKRK